MKVLLHHNVPKKLRYMLVGHDVSTAREMAWSELENGFLLREAEQAGFQLMITCDQNLAYQQNMSGREIALLILNTNNWQSLQRSSRLIVAAVMIAEPRSFRFLELTTR